ncbi:hypothetical protein, partial [uncultured Tyzzerella sp.]|uniref:hypothetical protein n=1 Tax=uncultured Tyzzerella sp. TaxID=2321398 RepID=UPI002942ECAC
MNTTYFYFENLNKKESYNSTFKENILKLFNTFENRFNESILLNKKVYRNYMIDNNSIYNRYFTNKKIDVYKKCLLN